MAKFLNVAEDLLFQKQVGPDGDHFRRVFEALGQLKLAQAQFILDADNLEEAFCAFEMARVCGGFGDIDGERATAVRQSMTHLIARTIEETFKFTLDEGGPAATRSYQDFVKMVIWELSKPGTTKITHGWPAILTMNYDMGIEVALHHESMPLDYCLNSSAQPNPNAIKILKLHGSLNWAKCSSCGQASSYDYEQMRREYQFVAPPIRDKDVHRVSLNISDKLRGNCRWCGQALIPSPLIVPPTWSKTEDPSVLNVWQQAARELREARYLVFIGYSFPATDTYFKYLLALGLSGASRLRSVLVVDPTDQAIARLRTWASPNLAPKIHPLKGDFANAIRKIVGSMENGP